MDAGSEDEAMSLTVERIDRIPIEVPFRDRQKRQMRRQWPSWKCFEIFEVELASGHIGYGQTMLFYTWNRTTAEDVDRVLGENAGEFMWDDTVGEGLQMALFDAVGRALDVPIHSLLGTRVHDRTELAWWCNDMPAENWVAECEEALDRGYRSIKLKGRPWFDLREQIRRVSEAVPPWFEVNVDFNATLLDAERAIPLLRELEQYPQVRLFEEPIPDEGLEGNRAIREAIDADIARHYTTNIDISLHDRETPAVWEVLNAEVCDGFVVTGGASTVTKAGEVAEMADRPFFLQQVGTDIAAAYSLHFAATLSHSRWPSVNCHQLYAESLLERPIAVEDGYAAVPEGPGLGYEIDWDTVESLKVERSDPKPEPSRLIEVMWPDGPTMYFATGQEMPALARESGMPYYREGVTTRLVPDDGSDWWQTIHQRALDGPVVFDD